MYDSLGTHAANPRNQRGHDPRPILLLLQWPEEGREEELFYSELGKSEYYRALPRKHGHDREVLAFEDRATGKPIIFRGFNLARLREGIRQRAYEHLQPVARGANLRPLKEAGEIVITEIEIPTMISLSVVNQAEPRYLTVLEQSQSAEPTAAQILH